MTAMRAAAFLFRGIEGVEKRRQIVNDAFQLNLDAVDEMAAVIAIPFEAVDHA